MQITRKDTSKKVIKQLDLLQTWVARSGDLPLSLCLRFFTDSSHLPQLLQTAMAHCQRWEYVELNVPFEHLDLIHGAMPLLRELIFGFTMVPNAMDETVLTLFDRAPRLKTVVLTDFFTCFVSLPWAQLTHLNGRYLFEHECTEILQDAAHLIHCQFHVCFSNKEMLPVVHSNLRDLTLRGDSDGSLGELLNHLTLPSLRTLRFYGPGIVLDSLEAFISRSHCVLEELRIDCSSLSEMTYREALPSVGSIILEPADE